MSQFALAHDRVLRGIIKAHSLSIGDWFKVLDGAGIQRSGFLGGLAFLQDEKKLSHDEATALAWAYLNPEVVPADLAKTLPGGGPKEAYEMTEDAVPEARPSAVVHTVTRSETRSSASTKSATKARPAAKPAIKKAAAKHAIKKAAAKPQPRSKKPAKKAAKKAGSGKSSRRR